MPTLADIENPNKPHRKDFIVGVTIGFFVVGLLLYFLVPTFTSTVLNNSNHFDQNVRQQNAYMYAVCSNETSLDDPLCSCVFSSESPSLDCSTNFLKWQISYYSSQCNNQTIDKKLLDFCDCIHTINKHIKASTTPKKARGELEKIHRCTQLNHVLHLPHYDLDDYLEIHQQ